LKQIVLVLVLGHMNARAAALFAAVTTSAAKRKG